MEECNSDIVSEVQRERVLSEAVFLSFCDFDDLIQNATEPELEYYGSNVPLFRRNGYRQSGVRIP